MGLIKAAVGALSGTLGDTWKEAIHCPVIGNDTVVVNGEKMHNGNARREQTTLSATAQQSWLKKTPVC